jgi:hypothetical protein
MTRVAIVGAGQAGLQLAFDLLKRGVEKGIEVLLISNRAAAEVKSGSIMSTQGMFDTALHHERRLGINFFDAHCPRNTSVTFSIAEPAKPVKAIHWQGETRAPFQAVDQRLKFSRWMDEFQARGGLLRIQDVKPEDLNTLSEESDLLIVAGGKSDISSQFQRDEAKSTYKNPQRVLSAMYVHGMEPATKPGVRANLIPGVGEYFCMPGLTLSGPCEMMLFEGIPGGPLDCWKRAESSEEHIALAKQLLRRFVPWEAERCSKIVLTDNKAILRGQYTPVIRKPFIRLPNKKLALGIGDIVILNDPIAGQGANNASRAAAFFANEIINRESRIYDEEWMLTASEKFWQQEARWSTMWTNLLLEPPAKHVLDLLSAAQEIPSVANYLAQAFENPISMFPLILSPKLTSEFIDKMRKAHEADAEFHNYATIENSLPRGFIA